MHMRRRPARDSGAKCGPVFPEIPYVQRAAGADEDTDTRDGAVSTTSARSSCTSLVGACTEGEAVWVSIDNAAFRQAVGSAVEETSHASPRLVLGVLEDRSTWSVIGVVEAGTPQISFDDAQAVTVHRHAVVLVEGLDVVDAGDVLGHTWESLPIDPQSVQLRLISTPDDVFPASLTCPVRGCSRHLPCSLHDLW